MSQYSRTELLQKLAVMNIQINDATIQQLPDRALYHIYVASAKLIILSTHQRNKRQAHALMTREDMTVCPFCRAKIQEPIVEEDGA